MFGDLFSRHWTANKWTPKFGPEAGLDFAGSAGHDRGDPSHQGLRVTVADTANGTNLK